MVVKSDSGKAEKRRKVITTPLAVTRSSTSSSVADVMIELVIYDDILGTIFEFVLAENPLGQRLTDDGIRTIIPRRGILLNS